MRLSDLTAAALSLVLFGILALLAWTGLMVDAHTPKGRMVAWIVEDVGVGNFGRPGAVALFATLGALLSLIALFRQRIS